MKKQITLLILILVTGCLSAFAQNITVKGVIKDSQGLPLPGAAVKVKGTAIGVATDVSGKYSISAPSKSTLIVTSVGFTTQEIQVGNRTIIDVTMADDNKQLNEVVVIGYGTRAVKDLTGAISSVKAEQLENENPANVSDLLKGNVPGIAVGLSTSPKGGGDLLVRGKASLQGNTSPLIVLDGVIYPGQLSDINPNDIERLDVLKDASSLAVYGSSSAAGVVAITTKKGKLGAPQISFNVNTGITQLEKNQAFYSPEGFLTWRSDVGRALNVSNPYYFYSDPRSLPDGVTLAQFMGTSTGDPVAVWLGRIGLFANEQANFFAGKTTDWSKLVFRNGLRQDYTASLSGKNEQVSYYMSGNYTKNENMIQGSDYKNYRTRLNLEGKAAKFLTLGVNAQYAVRDEGNLGSISSNVDLDSHAANWKQIINSSPYGDFYAADGVNLRRIDTDDNGLNQRNPFLGNYYNQNEAVQNTLFASLYAKVKLPFGIQYQLNFNPSIEAYRNFFFKPLANPDENVATGGEGARSMENRYKYTLDNLLTWTKTFGVHNFDVTLLLNKEKYETWYQKETNSGFSPNDGLGYHNLGAGSLPVISSDDRVYNADALMARLNYTLLGRYLLSASIRRDGFSPFGLKYPRSTYPAVGLGWVFTDESFMKSKNLSWLNYGKLRLSYGVNGNRLPTGTADPSQALALIGSGKYATVNAGGTVTNAAAIGTTSLQNNDLKWERTTSENIGLDFAVLNNRLSGSIDVYNRKTNDLIVNRAIEGISGFGTSAFVPSNIGEVNNKGFEISLSSKNYSSKNFNWSSSATFTLNRNKIVSLYGPTTITNPDGSTYIGENNDTVNGWFIGKDINAVWDYKILGVWQADEVAEAAKYTGAGIKPGDFKLEDVNGDHVYNDADKQFLGSKTPQFQWSLRNDFNFFKNFDFSFLLIANVGQLGLYNEAKNSPGSVGFNRQSSYVIPYWTADNPINDYARLNSGSNGTSFNVYRKTTFIRLNTVSVGYNLDKKLVQRLGIQSAKLYASGNNLHVFTDFPFWDPQNTGTDSATNIGSGPTPRVFSLGLTVTF
jgi:TonB-linked SusC/RagA family outer membrane protein